MGPGQWYHVVNDRIRRDFPNIGEDAIETSPATPTYNCVAWAIGESDRWWEGGDVPGYYWPENLPSDHKLTSLITMLESLGFVRCDVPDREEGMDKVAVYEGVDGEYSHVCKLLDNGRCSSKLGAWEDIEHRLEAVEGPQPSYGDFHCYMKRARTA